MTNLPDKLAAALTPAAVRLLELPPGQAVNAFRALGSRDPAAASATAGLFAGLPQTQVRRLDPLVRQARREVMRADRYTVWQHADIARAAGVMTATVESWRNVYLGTGDPLRGLLPPNVPTPRPYRQPADPAKVPAGRSPYATPMYWAGDVWAWLRVVGAVDEDLYRHDPPGRPLVGNPGQRDRAHTELVTA